MNDNTQYKDSSLGKIPKDWEMKMIKNVGNVSSGGTPDTKNEDFWNGNINWCTPTDISSLNGSKYIEDTNTKITELGLRNSSARILPENSIIVCTRATIGKAVINKRPMSTNQGFKNIIPTNIDTEFLYYKILNEENGLKRIANGSTFLEVSKTDFDNYNISVPPLLEQTRIAEVLSAWDIAISNAQSTIEQVQLRNKWLMQELLTGKRRLKGFSGEWKKVHIHEVAKEVSIRNKTDKQLAVLSCTKYNGLVDSLEYWGRKIYSEDISTYKIVPKNHFAYATNHIEEGSIGYQGSFDEALISPMYTVFKTDKSINDDYFFKLLKSHRLIYEYNARMEGSIDRRGGLRWDAFSILKINLPSLEEQTAISKLLQAADKEVQVLKSKLEKLKEQKKGLMQLLLTGKKRLNINSI